MGEQHADDRPGPLDHTRLFRSRTRRHLRSVARRLQHVRIVPGLGGDCDLLVAEVIGTSPAALAAGLERLGLGPTAEHHLRTFRSGRVHVTVAEHGRSVTFMVAGNTADEPWSFGEVDVRLAEELEIELIGADWIDGFLEPERSVNPGSYPGFFGDPSGGVDLSR